MRLAFSVSILLSLGPAALPRDASAAQADAAPRTRVLSFERLMDTHSIYGPYLDSAREERGPEDEDGMRLRKEIIGLFAGPGRLTDDMLDGILRIHARFAGEIAKKVRDSEVEEAYARETAAVPGLGGEKAALVREMIKAQLYLEDPATVREAERFLDLEVMKRQDRLAEKEAPIPWEALAIRDADGACLASAPDAGCLVTVKEFNAFLPFADEQTGRTVAEAREYLLKFYAFRKMKAQEGRAEGIAADRKAIAAHVRNAQEYRRMREALVAMGLGMPVTDRASLQDAYRKHYREHFAGRDSVLIQVAGSSDSAYADSLYRFLKRRPGMRTGAAKTVPAPDSSFPWTTFDERELPAELAAPTDSFRVGDFSAPVKTGWGYFIVKLSKVVTIPAVPFEKALAMCIYLATRDKFSALDSVPAAKAARYYRDHPAEFTTPDTVAYRFWRLPRLVCRSPAEYARKAARIRPMDRAAADLPRALTEKLDPGSIPDSLRMRLADTRYGQILVEIRGFRKGRIPIPFAKAKQGILEKLLNAPPARPAFFAGNTAADSAVSEEVLFTLGAGDLITTAIMERTGTITESEVDAAVESGLIDAGGSGAGAGKKDARFYDAARKRLEVARVERKQKEIQDRLNGLRFNTALLSGG